jgi:hypothetical protein
MMKRREFIRVLDAKTLSLFDPSIEHAPCRSGDRVNLVRRF